MDFVTPTYQALRLQKKIVLVPPKSRKTTLAHSLTPLIEKKEEKLESAAMYSKV